MENFENRRASKKLKEIEVEGKTLEEAIRRAVDLLKSPRNSLKITILAEEKKGLFGMEGAKPAKIRASLLLASTPKKKA